MNATNNMPLNSHVRRQSTDARRACAREQQRFIQPLTISTAKLGDWVLKPSGDSANSTGNPEAFETDANFKISSRFVVRVKKMVTIDYSAAGVFPRLRESPRGVAGVVG